MSRIGRGVATAVIVLVLGGLVYLRAWPPIVVVMSSSMEPTIDTGEIVLMRHSSGPPEVGDIVAVPVPLEAQALGYPDEVLHRVIGVTEDGLVRTQGDNLGEPDPFAVPYTSVTKEALTVIPGAGEFVAFLASPFGLAWVAAGLFLLVVMPFFDGQRELKLAVSEYGYHLRSHTQILKSMSVASQDLAATTERLRLNLPTHAPDGGSDPTDFPEWVVTSVGPVASDSSESQQMPEVGVRPDSTAPEESLGSTVDPDAEASSPPRPVAIETSGTPSDGIVIPDWLRPGARLETTQSDVEAGRQLAMQLGLHRERGLGG